MAVESAWRNSDPPLSAIAFTPAITSSGAHGGGLDAGREADAAHHRVLSVAAW
ncbi:hypothetical protein [Actinoplanes missouriensis]|uniref:hypothetical protein n=1 Tax=Actinoplanes missouriensis TaxID=1866 RepID=UPI0003FFA16C|nr:hypothetical protein [Actinoplanes missouriensis]